MHNASEKGQLDMMKLLLEYDADVEAEDANGRRTPLYLAAKGKHSEAVQLLLSYGASPLTTCFGKSAQEVIQEEMPYFDISKVEVVKKARRNSVNTFGYGLNKLLDKAQVNKRKGRSNAQNELQFNVLLARLSSKDLDSYTSGGMTLLQKACNYGLETFVQDLLDQGANPNQTTTETASSPLLLAAYYGHSGVIQVLMDHKVSSTEGSGFETADFSAIERTSSESILHYLLVVPDRSSKTDKEIQAYEDSLDLLLNCQNCQDNKSCRVCQEVIKVVNVKDSRMNTPLHYATSLWPQSVARQLLNKGANIGIKNIWDERPISKILPQVYLTQSKYYWH